MKQKITKRKTIKLGLGTTADELFEDVGDTVGCARVVSWSQTNEAVTFHFQWVEEETDKEHEQRLMNEAKTRELTKQFELQKAFKAYEQTIKAIREKYK